jgi:hypothetical protein
MKPDTYSVTVVWSDEDQAFVTEVSELPGCMAHGESSEQASEQIARMYPRRRQPLRAELRIRRPSRRRLDDRYFWSNSRWWNGLSDEEIRPDKGLPFERKG